MEKIAIAYIPVLHKGYVDFLHTLEDMHVEKLFLIGEELLGAHEELDYLHRKDSLRAVPLDLLQNAISAITTLSVEVLTTERIELIRDARVTIVTPQEDIGSFILKTYFNDVAVETVSIFLRWNRENVEANKEPDTPSSSMNAFQEKITALMKDEADKSFDWWRQVGAALVQDGQIVCVTHNEHLPEAQSPNIDGDVRSLFKKGINIHYSTAAHAEVIALGGAAKAGIKTEGAELYVTDFPCPYCARLIASAGIATVYFIKGYAVLEGDTFLKQSGVQVVKLETNDAK